MAISLLCIGDVVGRPGKFAIAQLLPKLISEFAIDCVIANVENVAGGSGLTPTLHEKLSRIGVHLMTMGDHVYRRREIIPVLESADNIVKPINLPEEAPGKYFAIHQTASGTKVAVVSVLGQQYMNVRADSPFTALNGVLRIIPPDVKIVAVDVHAEATSEKVAMGWFLDGRVSCVFGSHTHVQTADERIFPQGTAYITDLGMTGPYDSILGRKKERVLLAMRTATPHPFEVADGDIALCGIVVQIDPETGRAIHIERLRRECPSTSESFPRENDE